MRRQLVAAAILLSLCVTTVAGGMQSPTVFKKVDFFTHIGDEVDDRDAQLILDPQRRVLIFADEDHASEVFATVDWSRITGITYENSKHARITAGLLIAWPMLFLKGRKHWLTVTYGPAASGEVGGYVYARMDKGNYQAILAAINGFTGYEIRRVEEGGEVSILYTGVQPAPAPAEPAAAPAQTTAAGPPATQATQPQTAAVRQPASTPQQQPTGANASASQPAGALPAEALPAAPLPADSETSIAAAPLPPAADAFQPPSFVNKGVQWTERTGGIVGFVWAAEVDNPNSVGIDATVTLCLRDASGAVIHEAQEQVLVPPGEVAAFTTTGQMEESVALQAAIWTFDVEAAEPPPDGARGSATPPPDGTRESTEPPTSSAATSSAATGATTPPQPDEEVVPLTAAMVPPRLIAESVRIDMQDPELQNLNVSGKQISMRCLVQSD